mgnify:FL=1
MNMTDFTGAAGASWVYVILFLLFFAACVRARGSLRFAGAFLRDVVGVRERNNIFDATVRETSVILIAVLLSACSIGVLLCDAVGICSERIPALAGIPRPGLHVEGFLPQRLVCMGIVCGYVGIMWLSYYLVGLVFSDPVHTSMWVRGFTSSVALGVAFFFPLALVDLAYPELGPYAVLIGFAMLILVKILFIVKGFRIFFTESSFWVVFLYYLCSLEIVPLALTFAIACSLLG